MPDALEYIVRPYQAPASHGTIIIPSTPSGTRERATLKWGAKATMPSVVPGENFTVKCCADDLTEKSRDNNRIRITGSDPDDWIDVDRPYRMQLNKKEQNACSDNWEQLSGVASAISDDLAEWASDFSDIDAQSGTGGNCGTTWNF